MANVSCPDPNSTPTWGVVDVLRWKFVPERLGGGKAYIQRFKDGWVRHNRATIKLAAGTYAIPPELLAGTAWIEVGGDPTFIDRVAFEVRSFDWSGPKFVDDHLTITREPTRTSFGPVSMQLRTAAETMGLDVDALSGSDLRDLAHCLQNDVFNLNLVARHLRDLIRYDFPGADTSKLTPEQIKVAGARYNRGKKPTLAEIRKNLSYGAFILNMWPRLTALLRG